MSVCSDCKGKKVYKGLNVTKECSRCKGSGIDPETPSQSEPVALNPDDLPAVYWDYRDGI